MLYLCVQNLSVIINLQVVMLFWKWSSIEGVYIIIEDIYIILDFLMAWHSYAAWIRVAQQEKL